RAIVALEQPAEIRTVEQEHPDRFAARPGEVYHARIYRDDQVEVGHQRRRVGEIVQVARPVVQDQTTLGLPGFSSRLAQLQAVEADTLYARQRQEVLEGTRRVAARGGLGPA